VAECCDAGATAIELRDKEATAEELLRHAESLLPVARAGDALLIVNDRMDVALAAGADGVHLGPDDLPVVAARQIAPRGFLLGYSTDDPDEARAAAGAGADYLGVGAVYGTCSKPGLEDEAIGSERVHAVLEAAGLPGVGIGGITAENAGAVARAGAGVAVLGAVMGADEPGRAVRAILMALG
jgi:thiamine-phosphate pyrophosphorylase